MVLGTPALWGHVYMTLDLKEPEGVQREVDRAVSFCSWLRRHASDVHKLQFIITQRAGFDLQTAQLLELFSIACSSVLACAATLHTLTVIFPGPLTLSSCWLPASLKVLMVTGSTVKLAASCRELQLRELCIESGTPLDDESMAAMPPTLPFLYLEGAAVSVLPPSLAQATCLQVLQLHRGALPAPEPATPAPLPHHTRVLGPHATSDCPPLSPSDPPGSPSNTEVLARLGHLRELSLEELPQSTLPGLLESISQLTGLQALFIPRCSTPSSLDDLHLLLDDALARLPHLKILSLGAPFFCEEAPPSLVQVRELCMHRFNPASHVPSLPPPLAPLTFSPPAPLLHAHTAALAPQRALLHTNRSGAPAADWAFPGAPAADRAGCCCAAWVCGRAGARSAPAHPVCRHQYIRAFGDGGRDTRSGGTC